MKKDNTDVLKCIAKGGAQGKPRVFFTCHPADRDRLLNRLSADLINTVDCAVYYTEDMSAELSEDVYELDLLRMNLFVIPVSRKLLTEPNRAMDKDFVFAKEHMIPVLPIMTEQRLYDVYGRPDRFGELQYLDISSRDDTAVPFAEKLKNHMS